MADRSVVESLVGEMLGFLARKIDGQERAGAIDAYCRHFANTPNTALAAAVDAWEAQIPDDGRGPGALPPVRVLRKLLPSPTPKPSAPDTPPAPTGAIIEAPADVKAAHLRFRDYVRARLPIPEIVKHDHRPDAPACPRCTQAGARTATLFARIGELPGDPWAGTPRPCRCDGSGLVDTAASRAAVLAPTYQHREVHPCPVCRPDQFAAWSKAS